MARPKKVDSPETTTTSIRISRYLKENADIAAMLCGKSFSGLVASLLETFVNANQRKIDSFKRQRRDNPLLQPQYERPKNERPKMDEEGSKVNEEN